MPFEINVYFDDKGEDLEKIVKCLIINMLEEKDV